MADSDEIYEGIYNKIQEIVVMIENKKYDDAVCEYIKLMFEVERS